LKKFTTKTLHLISLGCSKNLVDSEVMLGKLSDYAISDNIETSDVIIINTCGFIEEAKKESLSTILEAIEKRKKGSLLVVAGCLTQRYRDELEKDLPEVDIFTGVGDYANIDKIIANKQNTFSNSTYLISSKDKRVVTGSNYHAFVKISEGCNQRCSFCAIPGFKGKLKSREPEDIAKEVKDLASRGYYDISFISQDSSSYGKDIGYKNDGLCEIISRVNDIDGIISARILYLYPTTMSFKLIDTINKSNIFHNYFDIPLQHISDTMLTKMKRGMKANRIKKLLDYIFKLDNVFLRTSFIVGHPGETEEDFKELCDFIQEYNFDRVSIFAYSDEESTDAYEFKDKISNSIIHKRIEKIEKIIENKINNSMGKLLNQEIIVSIDGTSKEHDYLLSAKQDLWGFEIDGEILINDKEIEKDIIYGARYKAKISDFSSSHLVAKVISKE
jgi:ribosomal protein S12 methylthiotransferase RimO